MASSNPNVTLWEDGEEADIPREVAERSAAVYECGDCPFWHLTDDFIVECGGASNALRQIAKQATA